MEQEDFGALHTELLEAGAPSPDPSVEPKRNSKQSLIEKILELSEQEGIPLEHSNTKLKRMNKSHLTNLCADLV